MHNLPYLQHYPSHLIQQIQTLIEQERLAQVLLSRYPTCHQLRSNSALYDYVQALKKRYMKQSAPISKAVYDDKLHVIKQALGTHTQVSRVQGGKLKAKHEIRIGAIFKQTPEAFLRMICVHELAHLREREHNKAFYKLCTHMEPDYHQLEFDLRVYLTCREHFGEIYS